VLEASDLVLHFLLERFDHGTSGAKNVSARLSRPGAVVL
jgi:hypothetical protein